MESAEELHALMKAVEATELKPAIDQVFSFSHVKEAYHHLKSQKHIGKVLISV